MNLKIWIKERNWLIITLIYAALCIFKLIFVIPGDAPVMFFDEFLYKENAKYLLSGDYFSSHYPPLYSLFLSLSFLIDKDNFYITMQIVNVFLSSAVIFPTWLIARRYLTVNHSFVISGIVALMPFQFVYTRLIYSENIYYAIITFLLLATIKSSERLRYIDSIIMGFTISLCLLSRYMTYSILPFIVIIWCVLSYYNFKSNETTFKVIKNILIQGMVIVISAIILSLPWIFLRYFKGYPILEIFNNDNLKYVSGSGNKNILKWTLFYFSYFILMMGPLVIPLIHCFVEYKKIISQNKNFKKYVFAAILITIPMLFTAIKHSSMAQYNEAMPFYIIGRYVMYLFPIWAIISFFAIQQIYLNQNLNKTKIVFSLLSGIFLIYSSYSSIIRGTVFNITDWFVMVHNAVEAFAYKGGGYIFLVFTLIILMLISICFMKRWSIKYINILLMIFFIVNSVICFNGINQTQNRLLLNNSIVNEIKDKYDKVFIKKDSISQQDYYINFWELRDIFVEYDEEGLFELQNGDVIITSQKLPLEVLYSYKSSYLYKYAEYGVHIDQVFPNTIKVGEKFNIQKSGRSALAIKGRGFIPGCYVIINGTKIETTYGSPELLSISLEQSFYDKEGELKVQVVFKDTIKSNEIIIPIN